MALMQLTKANFDEVVSKHDLVLISFSAAWCKPCQTFKKILEQLSEKCSELLVALVDIEEEETLAAEFQVQSVPATMILNRRVLVFAETGLMSLTALKQLVAKAQKAS